MENTGQGSARVARILGKAAHSVNPELHEKDRFTRTLGMTRGLQFSSNVENAIFRLDKSYAPWHYSE